MNRLDAFHSLTRSAVRTPCSWCGRPLTLVGDYCSPTCSALGRSGMQKPRTVAEVVAELRNAITPIMLLPDEAEPNPRNAEFQMVTSEGVQDAIESRDRIHALLNELSAMANPATADTIPAPTEAA